MVSLQGQTLLGVKFKYLFVNDTLLICNNILCFSINIQCLVFFISLLLFLSPIEVASKYRNESCCTRYFEKTQIDFLSYVFSILNKDMFVMLIFKSDGGNAFGISGNKGTRTWIDIDKLGII